MRAHRHDEMPFDVEGWLSSPRVQRMTSVERSMFFQLLCRAWADATCSLPDDQVELEFLSAAAPGEWAAGKARVMAMFELRDGRWINPKQREMLELQNQRLQTAKANRDRMRSYRSGKPGDAGKPDPETPGTPPTDDPNPPGIPARTLRFSLARPVLAHLNERTGAKYQETESNMEVISARLQEVDDDIGGVLKMIDRQVALWGTNPEMSGFLRPETLFGKKKFGSYYGQRDLPVVVNGKPVSLKPKGDPNDPNYCRPVNEIPCGGARNAAEERAIMAAVIG